MTQPAGDSEFELWWAIWPNKRGRGRAKKAFIKALREVDFDILMVATRAYADSDEVKQARGTKDWEYIRYPATWLNDEAWTELPVKKKDWRLTYPGFDREEIQLKIAGEQRTPTDRPG